MPSSARHPEGEGVGKPSSRREILQSAAQLVSLVRPEIDMYRAVTRDIRVTVTPQYLADRSSAEDGRFFWAYTIEIVNLGKMTVQLRSRHWKITDAHGKLQEVKGPGVVGEQPVLKPGERFEYTSGVPLTTPTGTMAGTYQMVSESGESFDVEIPAFSLDSPHGKRVLH